ncbi:catalase [Sphingomonas sp. ABOLD]|uniref:catalase n=1 Tax=Sphingomonas trueperi TaxID=53317 RepID=A0A7X6BCJ9_9SPHN|nr:MULTISPECIES: catalase family protein [Sphingomonas]NJB97653.1 catalase [Sphingomonas trueperi]RSV43532.1 catalase [Sphingomonas sp. ABOLE]RSV52859.1 catalase [Sphingomonas sp. ABOLD]
MPQPVRFSPSVEQPQPDEADTVAGLKEQFQKILDTTSEDYQHAVRSVHAKGHGLARGTFTIADELPLELAQGMFATPGSHEAILRFSTNAGDILDDSIRLPRGVALKVLGVEGERLPGSEGDTTQDFVMVNAPAFAAPDAKKFLGNLRLLAGTTDKAEGAKKLLSAVLRSFEATIEAVGGKSALLSSLGGARPVHPLGATYYSQTPYRYGDHIAKFQLVPVSGIQDFADATINATGRPDAMREAVNELLAEQGGTWELRVQLCTDLEKMPVEDASVAWDEDESPYRTVATLRVEPQAGWVYGESEKIEDRLSFAPWHGLAAHQPLGGVNRARQEPYKFSADYRGRFNGCPMHEPRALDELNVKA